MGFGEEGISIVPFGSKKKTQTKYQRKKMRQQQMKRKKKSKKKQTHTDKKRRNSIQNLFLENGSTARGAQKDKQQNINKVNKILKTDLIRIRNRILFLSCFFAYWLRMKMNDKKK